MTYTSSMDVYKTSCLRLFNPMIPGSQTPDFVQEIHQLERILDSTATDSDVSGILLNAIQTARVNTGMAVLDMRAELRRTSHEKRTSNYPGR
jgi:hypothetical protein